MRSIRRALLVAMLTMVLAGGCDAQRGGDGAMSGPTSGPTSSTTGSPGGEDGTAAPGDGAAGQAALEGLGTQVATTVRDLVEPLQAIEVQADTEPRQVSCKDIVGDDPWPQQQSFTANVFVERDSRPLARQVADELRRKGWTIQDTGQLTGPSTQHYVARREGFVITLGSTAAKVATLVISGTTPCVRRDGTVEPAAA